MKVNLQKVRRGTSYQSYRISIPKAIVEAKGWENCEFGLEDCGCFLKLTPVLKRSGRVVKTN